MAAEGFKKKACKNTITPIRHCTAAFAGQKYMLLFQDGRPLSTKIETKTKNNYAFNNVVVKFCDIFTYSTFKQHDIKKKPGGITF